MFVSSLKIATIRVGQVHLTRIAGTVRASICTDMDVTAEHALADVLGNAPKLVGGIVTLVQISERDAIYHRYATVAVPIERQRNSGIARILWGYMITEYTSAIS